MDKKKLIKYMVYAGLGIVFLICITTLSYLLGQKSSKKVAVDFTCETERPVDVESKYKFIDSALSDYICGLCDEVELDPDLVVAILMVENPEFNKDAVHRNENGTIDVGLFQLNDRYLWTTFKYTYWFDNIELDPFNWKHNTYIAVHHLEQLQKKLKVTDDVIMAYNCGIGAVMNGTVPAATKVYFCKVNNNLMLLKGKVE